MHHHFSEWPANQGFSAPTDLPAPFRVQMEYSDRYDLPGVMSELPGTLRDWVQAIVCELEVDRGLALSTLLSGMGSAVQGARTVRPPQGSDEPLAHFSFILAGPTTGKTRTHRLVHQVHNAHDIRRYQSYRAGKRRSMACENPKSNLEGALDMRDPAARLRSIILQDTTNRGLLEALDGVGESTAISVDEGERVLETALFRRQLATLNSLYDGAGKVMLRRGNGDVLAAYGASLTILVMVQPDVFEAYLAKHGAAARGVGFFARCLFTALPAFAEWIAEPVQPPEGCLDAYHAKASAFLDARLVQLESGGSEAGAICFSPAATQLWFQLAAEQRRLAATDYWHAQDAANRSMQNVARLAGIIHCYCDHGDDISIESLRAAWAIVQWSLSQFARIFPPKPLPPVEMPKLSPQQKRQQRQVDDCQTILDCIADACARNREPDALKSNVFIRSGLYNARFRTALMRLVDEGVVLETEKGSGARLSIMAPSGHPDPCSRLNHSRL